MNHTRYDCIAIVDEIYQSITFGTHKHISIASLEGMSNRTVIIHGISKIYAATGWRVGWAVAPPDITPAIRRVHDFLTGTVPTPFQDAAISALKMQDSYYTELRNRYNNRKKIMQTFLDAAGITYFPPEGTYYILTDISPFGFNTSEDFVDALIKEAGVAVVPGTAFYRNPVYRNHMVRFTFSKDENTLLEAGERLVKWVQTRKRISL